MFREWFDEPERDEDAQLTEAVTAIRTYRRRLQKLIEEQTPDCGRYTRFDIWCRGLILASYELEASVYAAEKLCVRVTHTREEEMDETEQNNYRKHVYFYKNGFIRLFSVLDKLGYLMNELLVLRTERVKSKFSYFTVLRQMQHKRVEADLVKKLSKLKEEHQEPLDRLRRKRNMEIHLVNSEILDDLLYIDMCRSDRSYIEDLRANMDDLHRGSTMVCGTLTAVFTHLYERRKP